MCVRACARVKRDRESERASKRARDGRTDRQIQRWTDRQRNRGREGDGDREIETDGERQTDRERV